MPDLVSRNDLEANIEDALLVEFGRFEKQITAWMIARESLGDLSKLPKAFYDELYNRILAILKIVLKEAYLDAHRSFSSDVQEMYQASVVMQRADAYVSRYAPVLARQLIETTEIDFERIAVNAPSLPSTSGNLVSALEASGTLGSNRSSLIARTEVTQAIASAESQILEDLRNKGTNIEATWYTQLDERVCVICEPRHSRQQGTNWEIPPPAHPNCRCEVEYVIIKEDGTRIEVSALEVRQLGGRA